MKAHLADVKAKSIGPRFELWFKIATHLWKAYKTANSDAISKEVSGARMHLRDDVKECDKAAVGAASEGMPLDTKFTLESYDNEKVEMTLKETKEKVCGLLAKEAKRVLEASAKAYAASMAPYRAALKGDKLAMFEKYGPSASLYGSGCRLLDSPSDYANAPVWYDVLLDDRDWLLPRWTVRGYKFKGMSSSGSYEKSGIGVDAPAAACP